MTDMVGTLRWGTIYLKQFLSYLIWNPNLPLIFIHYFCCSCGGGGMFSPNEPTCECQGQVKGHNKNKHQWQHSFRVWWPITLELVWAVPPCSETTEIQKIHHFPSLTVVWLKMPDTGQQPRLKFCSIVVWILQLSINLSGFFSRLVGQCMVMLWPVFLSMCALICCYFVLSTAIVLMHV